VDDMRRTKEVMKNTIKLFLQSQVDKLGEIKSVFDEKIIQVSNALTAGLDQSQWAKLGAGANKPAGSLSSGFEAEKQNPAGRMLSHHFEGNVEKSSPTRASTVPAAPDSVFDVLLDAIKKEGQVVDDLIEKIKDTALKAAELSVAEVVER